MSRKVYLLDTSKGEKNPVLKIANLTIGISDGIFTEVKDGLKEGDVVVTSVNVPVKTPTAAGAQPGGQMPRSPFGGGGFRPR